MSMATGCVHDGQIGIDGDCDVLTTVGTVRVRDLHLGDVLVDGCGGRCILDGIIRIPSEHGYRKLCKIKGLLICPKQQVFVENAWRSAEHLVEPTLHPSRSTYLLSGVGARNILVNGLPTEVLRSSAKLSAEAKLISRL